MNDLVEQKNCVQILLEEERTLIPNLVDIQALYDSDKVTKIWSPASWFPAIQS